MILASEFSDTDTHHKTSKVGEVSAGTVYDVIFHGLSFAALVCPVSSPICVCVCVCE